MNNGKLFFYTRKSFLHRDNKQACSPLGLSKTFKGLGFVFSLKDNPSARQNEQTHFALTLLDCSGILQHVSRLQCPHCALLPHSNLIETNR